MSGCAFGYWYVDKSFLGNEYENVLNQQVDFEGIVATDPAVSGTSQLLTLQPDGFTQLMRTSLYTPIPDVKAGDRVWIRGQVQLPENFSGFDYIGHL